MTCQSSKVPITPMSAIQGALPSQAVGPPACGGVTIPTRKKRRHAPNTRLPDVLSSTASATIEATTEMTPSTITASFRAVGVVMNRVSTSMRADSPGWAATFRSVKTPAT